MKITAHTIVKNEENYLWFSVMSAIDYVDEVLLWDTGSSDNTLKIIEQIAKLYPKKVKFKEVGGVDSGQFTTMRQKMLEETDCDWLMILDGDDVWWDDGIRKTLDFIRANNDKYDTLVHSYQNPVGDIYHYQDLDAHKYRIDDKYGNVGIRFMNRKIEGLNVNKPHGQQGFFNKDGVLVQEMDPSRRFHMQDTSYLHFTNLPRSNWQGDSNVPKRKMKLKYEIGNSFPLDFYYPEVLFKEKPDFIPSPWKIMSTPYRLKSTVLTPLKKLKRKLIKGKVGY